MKKILITICIFFPLTAFAVYPTEDMESYTSGNDLNGGAGGSGWSENWGATTACGVSIDTLNTPTLQGGMTAGGTMAAGVECRRNFAAQTTDDLVVSEILRSGQTGVANKWAPQLYWRTGTNPGSVINNCYENGNTVTFDNTTLTSLEACSANTNYTIEITIKPSTEEHRIKFNGTQYPSSSTYFKLYNYTVVDYTGGLNNANPHNEAGIAADGWFDDIKDVTPAAVVPPTELDDSTWFQILWNWIPRIVNLAYAK